MAAPNFDVIKEIPGYKVILKTVLKAQIQLLVKQLEEHTDEQSVILTASMGDGTLSHLGSDYGQSFLNDFEDFKFSFLGFCLKKHNKKQLEDQEAKAKEQQLLQEQQIAQATQTPIHINPAPPSGFSNPSSGGRERVMKPKQFGSSVRHEPYPITRPQRTGFTVSQTSASAVKLEPSFDNENNSNSSGVFPDGGDVFQPHSGDSNSFTGSAQVGTVDQQSNIINAQDSDIESIVSGALVQIKREVEDDLEITGVEPGIQPPAQDAWGSSASSDACPADTSAQQAYSAALEVQPGSTLAELAQLSGSGRQCGVCGRQFSTRQNLERHLILHTGQRPFKCETCGRRFTQVSHLKSHKLVHMRRVIAGMEDRI